MGYQEGRNVRITYRWAEGHGDRLQGLAADLVRERVSVIVTPGSVLSALSAKAATATIPIVFEIGADPVAFGLVSSMSRPGGNITGVTSLNVELNSKRLELLHEVVPRLSAVAVLVNPANPQAGPAGAHLEAAARARGLRLHHVRATTETEIDTVFETLPRLGVEGLVIAADQFFVGSARQLASLALHQALPAIHFTREFPDAGGLMSYGGTFAETHRLTGVYAGRILKGEKPAGLPVQQAAQFEMAVNLATARTLRLTFPPSLLARADEVIE
jgi:putative ABC transport system substrate-binding protein